MNSACWLVLQVVLSQFFFTPPRATYPGWHCQQWSGYSFIHHWSRKCPHGHAHRPVWWRRLLSRSSLSSGGSSVCPAGKNWLAQQIIWSDIFQILYHTGISIFFYFPCVFNFLVSLYVRNISQRQQFFLFWFSLASFFIYTWNYIFIILYVWIYMYILLLEYFGTVSLCLLCCLIW